MNSATPMEPTAIAGNFIILPGIDIAYRPIGSTLTWAIVSEYAFTVSEYALEQVVEHQDCTNLWTCSFQSEVRTRVRVERDGVLIAEIIPMEAK